MTEPVLVRRFDSDAEQEAKAQFARDLIFALDAIGVRPGDGFLVTTTSQIEALEEEAENATRALQDRLEEVLAKESEDAHAAELYYRLLEELKDVPRGIRSVEEVLEAEGIR